MIKVYNVVASGGEREDSQNLIVATFTEKEDAERYREQFCTLEKEGCDPVWRNNEDFDEFWSIQVLDTYTSWKEYLNLGCS